MPIKDPKQPRRVMRLRQVDAEHADVPQPISVDLANFRVTRTTLIDASNKYDLYTKKRQVTRMQRLIKQAQREERKKNEERAKPVQQPLLADKDHRLNLPTRIAAFTKLFRVVPELVVTNYRGETKEQLDRLQPAHIDSGESSSIARDPILDFAAEAGRLGVPMEPIREIERAKEIIKILAKDAVDLFESTERGVEFLSNRDIDGYGNTGLSLLAARGVSAVLMKLDELRFGSAC